MKTIISGKRGQSFDLNVATERPYNEAALAPSGLGMSFSIPEGAKMVDIASAYARAKDKASRIDLGGDPDKNPFKKIEQEGTTMVNYGIDIEKLLALDPKDLDAE